MLSQYTELHGTPPFGKVRKGKAKNMATFHVFTSVIHISCCICCVTTEEQVGRILKFIFALGTDISSTTPDPSIHLSPRRNAYTAYLKHLKSKQVTFLQTPKKLIVPINSIQFCELSIQVITQ